MGGTFFKRGAEKSFIHEGVGRVIGNNKKWGADMMALGRHYHPSKGQGREEVQNQVRTVTRQELRKSLGPCQSGLEGGSQENAELRPGPLLPTYSLLVPLPGQAQWEIKGQEGRGKREAVHGGQETLLYFQRVDLEGQQVIFIQRYIPW